MWNAAFIISLFPASLRRRGKTAVIKTEGVPPGKIGNAWNTTKKTRRGFFPCCFHEITAQTGEPRPLADILSNGPFLHSFQLGKFAPRLHTHVRMKIAVIGKGGREHALVKALKESPSAPEMYCFPGSDAINRLAEPIPARDLPTLIDWMVSNKVDLCVAGEESYLVKDEGWPTPAPGSGFHAGGRSRKAPSWKPARNSPRSSCCATGFPPGRPAWPPRWKRRRNSSAEFIPPS